MNIKSCRLKSRTEQEEGCQDPGETMVKPPLKAYPFFSTFTKQVRAALVTTSVLRNLPQPHSPTLPCSASRPTVAIDTQGWKGPSSQALKSTGLQSRNLLMADKFTCNVGLNTPLTGSSLPCDIACCTVGQLC